MLLHGDCLEQLKTLESNSIDSLVTDPPAGISFMGKDWDSDKGGRDGWVAWMAEVMRECHRVLKPGAHAFVWAIPRTSHWTATALEDAGFEIRDVVTHLFGQGFPKSLNISLAMDKERGRPNRGKAVLNIKGQMNEREDRDYEVKGQAYAANSDLAKAWQGWGTALKPASEHWILCRKRISEKTVAKNVEKWGCGGINIDGCRVEGGPRPHIEKTGAKSPGTSMDTCHSRNLGTFNLGRFPANLVLSHTPHCQDDQCDIECAIKALDEQSGISKSTAQARHNKPSENLAMSGANLGHVSTGHADSGGASRFFYCAKISKSERNAGFDCVEIINISCGAWEKAGLKVQLQVDTARSVPRVIGASGTWSNNASEWNTLLFGSDTSDLSRDECKSTTKTKTNSTTESKTLNWLARSFTSVSIRDVSSLTVNGGSLADRAKYSSMCPSIINGLMDFATSANLVLESAQFEIRSAGKQLNGHPTVKSSKLMRYLCRMITPPGGVVLDPFMGSGSTGIAAKKEGFKFIGIEREAEYHAIAVKRIEHVNLAEVS